MSGTPRAVFGMPAYNRPDTLARALESLVSQTFRDFAIVIVDDKPSPEVKAIAESYAALHPRITYEPNPQRLGMVDNWRKAFIRAQELYPGSEFFAFASDHDFWHPRWLEALIEALDRNPQAVLAYPRLQRVYKRHRRAIIRHFDTLGLTEPLQRLRAVQSGMSAGNCIYGLFRARVLAQAGIFRPVLAPDRQVLVQCLLFGELIQVPEVLWYREVAGMFSYKRQRRMFFPGWVPLHTYLPSTVQHFAVVLWDMGVRGRGLPQIGRLKGAGYAVAQLWYESKRQVRRLHTLSVKSRAAAAARRGGSIGSQALPQQPDDRAGASTTS